MNRFSTTGLARISALHPWRVLATWIVVLIVAVPLSMSIGDHLTTDFSFYAKPESIKGQDLLEKNFGTQALTETIVLQSDTYTVDDPAFQAVITNVMYGLRAMPEIINSDPAKTFSYLDLQG